MSEQVDGNPIQADSIQVVGPLGEAIQKEPVSGSAPQKEDEAQKKEGDSTVVEKAPPDEIREAKRKADKAHSQVIDLIEDKFKLLDDRKMEDEELRKWFLDHPEFADTANRSKRMKDKFRNLMERSPEVRRGEKMVPESKEEVDDDKPEEKRSLGDKPLTSGELMKMLDERDERLIERSLTKERDSKAEDFAAEHKVLDEEYTKLKRNAEALFEANDDWTYERALEAALTAMNAGKPKPLNVAAQGERAIAQEGQDKVDLTQPTPLMDWDQFSGAKRK